MAINGSFSGSSGNKYVQPTITWSAKQDIAGNYSDVTATLTYSRTNTGYTTYGTWAGGITINGVRTADSKYVTITYNSNTVALTATVRVYHNADGSKSITISADGGISGTSFNSTSCSSTITLDPIPRQAYIDTTRSYDFTDLDSPTVYFNNPAGSAVKVMLCISWTGLDDIAYRELDDYSHNYYTFKFTPDELNKLYNATLEGSTSRRVTFYVSTIIGSTWYRTTHPATFTVTDCEPSFTASVSDEGDTSYALTNDRNKLIRYFNYPKAVFSNIVTKKGASIVKKTVTCGKDTKIATDDYVQFNNVDTDTFIFTVEDNRGHKIEKPIPMTMINYDTLTCNSVIETNLDTNNTANIDITVNGKYFEGSLGAVNNELSVEYRYKTSTTEYPVDDSGNEKWTPVLEEPTISDGNYSVKVRLTGLYYKDTYTIQVRAKDAVYKWGVSAKDSIVKIVPVFDWGEDDFNFNVPVTIEGQPANTRHDISRICRAFTQETDIPYEANSYIKLFRNGSPTDLYNTDLVTFNDNGTITFKKDMLVLVNVHVVSHNSNSRSWIKLMNYSTNWKFTDCINYGLYTTSQITIILNVTQGQQIGVVTVEPMTMNSSGLTGSYIELYEL